MANKYLNDTGLQYFFNKLKTLFLTNVAYDSTNKKITKTVNGTTTDVVTLATMKTDMALNNVANGAEVNQNAFSNVKVGTTTVAADSKTDTLELAAGTNITLTPDATNDKVTIATSAEVNQNTFAKVTVGSTTIEADAKQDTLTLVAGSNVTITPDATNDNITIAATDTTYTPASESPKMDGTAAVGTSAKYAREDHVHPKDTSKANLASPTFTGTPKAPTAAAGTNTTQIATTAFVKTAVDNAVGEITQFDIQVVTELPATGVKGTIYLLSHSHGTSDVYDEYIWTGTTFEKIGNTDIDLSGYMKTTDMVAITTSEIDTLFA